MGLPNSKQEARLDEILILIKSTDEVVYSLRAARKRDAERAAAGALPSAPGCDQALLNAVHDHHGRLVAEYFAILDHQGALWEGRFVPMPKPTPLFNLTPPPEPQVGATPALAAGPGTPMGRAGAGRGRSSSSEEQGISSSREERKRRSSSSREERGRSSSSREERGRSSSEEERGRSSSEEERGRSSSSREEGAPARSGKGSSETVPLLGIGTGRLPPGLRQRHGHGDVS